MKKNNPRIKENITLADQINAIERIVSSYFEDGDYTPYYYNVAAITSIALDFIDGVEFDENEIIYESVITDKEVYTLVEKFIEDTDEESCEYKRCMDFVKASAFDKIEFLKQQMIHMNPNMDKIYEIISGTFENLSKLDLKLLSPDNFKLAMNVFNKLYTSDISKEAITQIIKDTIGSSISTQKNGIAEESKDK